MNKTGRYAGWAQVKQYVAVLKAPDTGVRFMVFKTQDPGIYLFSALVGETLVQGGLQFPVKAADLRTEYRRALAHGWGNSL